MLLKTTGQVMITISLSMHIDQCTVLKNNALWEGNWMRTKRKLKQCDVSKREEVRQLLHPVAHPWCWSPLLA